MLDTDGLCMALLKGGAGCQGLDMVISVMCKSIRYDLESDIESLHIGLDNALHYH